MHRIVKCSECDKTIGQCRCMKCDKTVVYEICDECKKIKNEEIK